MTFEEILQQTVDILQNRGKVSYRALQRQFELDDAYLVDLKDEILYAYPQVVDDGRGLAWTSETMAASPASNVVSPIAGYASVQNPHAYTPPHLAEKILTSHAALQGERKQVTVLFCDLANSTGLAEQLGPETMHTVLNQFFELALGSVHRYEGTINQFLGDGFMALFGAPIAHEDHARRAVLAALELRRQLFAYNASHNLPQDIELSLRMGINTGIVVVGAIGDNLRMDYTAVGDTTNTAARLEQEASSDQIVISGTTHRLVGGYCTTNALGSFALKGKTEPIEAWEVIAAQESRTRLEVEAEQGLTPFVARSRELRILHECMAQAQAGHGQVVFLVGEAGIGKSRLLLEFRHQLVETEATWLEGHAMSFGQSMALHPLVELIKRNFRIEEADPEGVMIAKIEQGVLRLGEDLRSILPYLRMFLAVDPGDAAVATMDPQLRRAEIFEALRCLLLRAAEIRPQVLVFEDLHWIDNATEAFLRTTLDSIATSRILCLFTYRPGYSHPFGDRTYYTGLTLPTLSSSDSVTMAQAILDSKGLPKALETLITRKAEGNPFFIEEVVKSLQEMGAIQRQEEQYVLAHPIEDIVVPDTIQDVLMARIDRLADAPKQTLQLASVIGREFTYRLLDRLADIQGQVEGYLQELKAIELIYETSVFPELAYMFKHALTQDVAYHSLLVQRRQALHRLVGQAIEELYADRLAEHYEVLAYHFAKGQDWAKALAYFRQAGEKASRAFANREAIALYDQALEAADQLGDLVDGHVMIAIHQARANVFFALSDFEQAIAEGQQALHLARQCDDRKREGMALAGMGLASLFNHEFDRALAYSRQAITVAQEADVKPAIAVSHFAIGSTYVLTARITEGKQELEQALAVSQSADDVATQSLALAQLSFVREWKGEFNDALHLASQSLQISRQHNQLFPLLLSYFSQGLAYTGRGDYDDALTTFTDGLALAEKSGEQFWGLRFLNSFGWLYSECGNLDLALHYNQLGAEEARKSGESETIANAELNLADVFFARGNFTLAHELLDGVSRLVRDPATSDWMKWRYSTHLFASLGELHLARGELHQAQESINQCLEIATRTHSQKYIVKGRRLQGQIALAQHDHDEAGRWFQQALSLAQSVGNPTQLWQTHLAWGRLHSAMRHGEKAKQAYQAAQAVIDQARTKIRTPELRANLARSPLMQRVYDLGES